MKLIYLLLIIALISCGKTNEQLATEEKAKQDSIMNIAANHAMSRLVDAADGRLIQSAVYENAKHIYMAVDYGLIPGIIVRQTPRDWDGSTPFPTDIACFHIRQPNGIVKTVPINEQIWTVLYIGDSLQ